MSEPASNPPDASDPGVGFLSRYAGIPDAGWGAAEVALGVVVATGAILMGLIAVGLFDPGIQTSAGKDASQLVVALALGGTALGFAAAYAAGRSRGAFTRLGLDRFGLAAIGLAALAWLAYFALAALLSPLLSPDQQDVTRKLGADTGSVGSVVATALLLVVAAPIAEELFFRGFMFAGLRRSIGGGEGGTNLAAIWPAAVISALIWGSLHLGGGDVGVALQLAVFGVILAWLYERSGTLWAPIVAHMINNSVAVVALLTDLI